MPPPFRVETTFEVTGIRVGVNKAKGHIVLSGQVRDQGNFSKHDGIHIDKMEIHIHTDDGQSPYPLGHILKVIVLD